MPGDVKISVVVVAYDIDRELPRTLRSLSADYQVGIDAADFEVIIVDNGSPKPVDESAVLGSLGQLPAASGRRRVPVARDAVNVGLAARRVVP